MRVILVAIGSRGDVEPFCSLAKELLLMPSGPQDNNNKTTSHHSIEFVVQSNWSPLISDSFSCQDRPLVIHELPFSNQDFYRVQMKKKEQQKQQYDDPRMSSMETVANIIGHLVLPFWEQLYNIIVKNKNIASTDMILIMGNFGRQLCLLIAKRFHLPLMIVHFQPLVPNQRFPNYRVSIPEFIHAILSCWNDDHDHNSNDEAKQRKHNQNDWEETYWRLEHALEEFFLKDILVDVCQEIERRTATSFRPFAWSELQDILTGQSGPQYFVVNAFSHHLIPSCGIPTIAQVGPLADSYVPHSFTADMQTYYDTLLDNFQEERTHQQQEAPICIGFGSMACANTTISILLQALERLDKYAILVGGKAPSQQHQSQSRMLYLPNSIPYSYLLPKTSVMLCHGGAGVVHACLYAGIPCWICPTMGDQFAFAKLMQAKGLGMQCTKHLKDLSVDDLVTTYRQVMACRSNCQKLRNIIRRQEETLGSGCKRLIQVLERQVEYMETQNPANLQSPAAPAKSI